MGLFSETVTTYASQVLSLIEENPKFIPSTIKNAILTGADISDSLHSALTNNIALSAKRYYSYGKDYYYYGLPTGTFSDYFVNVDAVQSVLETIEQQNIYVAYTAASEAPDGRFFITDWLASNNYSWEDDSFSYMGHACTLIYAKVTANNEVTVSYSYRIIVNGGYILHTSDVKVTATVTFNTLYIIAAYQLLDETNLPTGKLKTFAYLVSSNLYPELAPINLSAEESPYYPVVPIREDNVSLSNMAAYPSAKRLLKKIGVDVDDVLEGIESNPDIGDIDYAYIVIGFNMNSTSTAVINYMHSFFSYMADNSRVTKDTFLSWLALHEAGTTSNLPPMNALTIKDIRYRATIAYRYITKTVVTGVLGEVGTVDKEIVIRPKIRYYNERSDSNFRFGSLSYSAEDSSLILKKQLTETTYEEIEVRGLLHTNYVNGKEATDYVDWKDGIAYVYGKGAIETSLAEVVSGDDNNNFIVPLNSVIYNNALSMNQRIDLMYDSIQIVINSYEKTKLKWYQTGFFQFVMLVITIALTIYGMPELGVTLQTATATEIAVMFATQLAITVTVQLAVRVAIKALGINGALAAILIVVAAVATYRFTGGSGMKNMPWAKEMMSAVNTLPSAYNKEVSAMTEDIMEDMAAFQQSAQTQLDEINKKLEEITKQSNLDPLGIFALMDYYPNESIDDYYYRHCHMGNPGVLTLDAITDYVDNMLNIKQ